MKARALNPYDVRVGQVWKSCDKREEGRGGDKEGRRLLVERIEGGYAVCARFGLQEARRWRIRLDRFREISTGYRLIR